MPAERAGFTVTMFVVDVSPSMNNKRVLELPPDTNGDLKQIEITNLEWALQFVKLKVQEMIFNGRKTDQCGVVIFGSADSDNTIHVNNGGYEHVSEYIPIGQPNAQTLRQLDALKPSGEIGDPIDALIVAIETQDEHLRTRKRWARKIILVTDGSNPMEIEDWEATVKKMNSLDVSLTIVGVDFDDQELPYEEPNKTDIKRINESFYRNFISKMKSGVIGTCALALREAARPDIKQTKSTLMGSVLRLGDVENKPKEALEIMIKTSKCTAISRPKSWKKFARRDRVDGTDASQVAFTQLRPRTEYFVDRSEDHEGEEGEDVSMEEEGEPMLEDGHPEQKRKEEHFEKVEKEELIKGYKYGTTYAPCPDGQFPRLPTKKGMDICGFFPRKNFRRELSMGEIQYVWADPSSGQQQAALSSIVQAMYEKDVMAIVRWVTKDGVDPKMGVLTPIMFQSVDCFLFTQMPFADDVRKYPFASLDHLISKKGEPVTEHSYLPTKKQVEAMDHFVDAMDLMDAGEKTEDGTRLPWFDTLQSYNPALHRIKQAMFHCAVVSDLNDYPLPPPHPELLKYFDPPKRVLKRARDAIEDCKETFKIRSVPKKVARTRADGHVHAEEGDDTLLLLERKLPPAPTQRSRVARTPEKKPAADDSETEEEEEENLPKVTKPSLPSHEKGLAGAPLPTPARSVSPEVDLGRAPGRIVGSTYPLADFRKNLEQGDVVSKAVEDLGAVITEIVMRPFTSRRISELLECMRSMRDTCLKEDEIDAWNAFLQALRNKCLSDPGNAQFWSEVKKVGRSLSLISHEEAADVHGTSDIPEKRAEEFVA